MAIVGFTPNRVGVCPNAKDGHSPKGWRVGITPNHVAWVSPKFCNHLVLMLYRVGTSPNRVE